MLFTPTAFDWAESTDVPSEHHAAHDFMMFQYSNIVALLNLMKESNQFGFRIEGLTEEQANEFAHSDDPIGLLSQHGKLDELNRSVVISVTPALVSEFCSTLYEVLHLLSRRKCSLVFQLLRKQLNETLIHMEWMASYPEDYVEHFNSGDPKELQPLSVFATPERRKQMIQDALKKIEELPLVPPVFSADLLYLVRFDRSAVNGYYRLTQQAIHLITAKYHELATEPYNLNFIFSDDDALRSQQDFLYRTLPYLCDYFRQVALVVLGRISNFDTEHQTWWLDEARRIAGLELLSSFQSSKLLKGKAVAWILGNYGRKCPECSTSHGAEAEMSKDELHRFMYDGEVVCAQCSTKYFAYDNPGS